MERTFLPFLVVFPNLRWLLCMEPLHLPRTQEERATSCAPQTQLFMGTWLRLATPLQAACQKLETQLLNVFCLAKDSEAEIHA